MPKLTTCLSFSVFDKPIQKGSFRGFVIKPERCKNCATGNLLRTAITNDNKNTKKFQKQISDRFINTFTSSFPVWQGAIKLTITFYFRKPKSCPPDRCYPKVKPDLDKLVRTVLDALTDVLYPDDAQVVSLVTHKRYGRQNGVKISAEHLTEIEKGEMLPIFN